MKSSTLEGEASETTKTSGISGFYKLGIDKRMKIVKEFASLSDDEVSTIRDNGLGVEDANRMIENVIGTIEIPIGIVVNFRINNKDYMIPMATEEASVVAAASNAAKMARTMGGFMASTTDPVMVGQIQLTGVNDPNGAKMSILSNKKRILDAVNEKDRILIRLGGGAKDIEVRVIDTLAGPMVISHLLVNVKDAMGANAVNTMVEAAAPIIEEITGGRVMLKIISNLAVYRLARARAVFDKETIGGEDVVDAIITAYAFADGDLFRCATHNKGIMNGITAVVLATGNDTRAVEAGVHAYASISGEYMPFTTWEKNSNCDLVGTIEIPMPVGIIGGATAVHPVAKANIKILNVKTASEMAEVIASVGLAQNLAALRALATEGIQRGHMSLHAKNIAVMAGAKGDEIDRVAGMLVEEGSINLDKAKEVVGKINRADE